MVGNRLLRLVLSIAAWLVPVASCTAWTTRTTNHARSRSVNACDSRASKVWGVPSGGGELCENNIVAKESTHRVLILMDVFCGFHGLYLTDMARVVYGVRCVHVLSEYMANYFLSKQDKEGNENEMPPLPPHMPSSPEEVSGQYYII